MQHLLELSVIILYHVASSSRIAVGKQLQPPLDSDTEADATDYTQLKQRDYDIANILKQLLERSSTEISEHQESLAKLTIEPYNKNSSKDTWQGKDPLHWFDESRKTIAPLAIIVTNLPEINKLHNSDKNKEKKYLIQNKETTFDSNADVIENPKKTMAGDLNTDVKSKIIDSKSNDNLEINSKDLEVSIENYNKSNDLSKEINSPLVNVGLHSKEELFFDELELKDGSDEITKHPKSIEIIEKMTHDDTKSYTTVTIDKFDDQILENDTLKVDFSEEIPLEIIKRGDATKNEKQKDLINLLLVDTDKHETVNNGVLNNETKIILKFKNDGSFVESEIKPAHEHERKLHKCRKQNGLNTYNLSFLFNR